jgi:hypothetical protein
LTDRASILFLLNNQKFFGWRIQVPERTPTPGREV